MRAPAVVVTVLALAGCPADAPPPERAELTAITAAPPGSRAAVVNRYSEEEEVHEIELSLGVAIAVRCWDTCGPDAVCSLAKLTAGEPALLGVRPVYRGGPREGEFALIASGAGATTLRVQTSCAAGEYRVTVRP